LADVELSTYVLVNKQ